VSSSSETPEPDSEHHARPDALSALRNPNVRAFVVGQIASAMGAQFISVAIGWELYERTGDPWALGMVGLFEVAPVFFLMLPAGHAADRFPRRNVAMATSVLFTLGALGLTYVSWARLPVEAVYGLLVVIGAARAFASPSLETLLPQLLDRRQFANAQVWMVSSFQLSSISGPALCGLLIALIGAVDLPAQD